MYNLDPSLNKILANSQENINNVMNAMSSIQENKAKIIASKIHSEITNFQSSLPDNEDVALSVVQFGSNTTIAVCSIGYIDNNLIVFFGDDNQGKPLELIQHINQLSFLLMVVQKPNPETPKRKIGFEG